MIKRGGSVKLNNKGFAISGILYAILILFLVILIAILGILGSRKVVLDKVKMDVFNMLNEPKEEKVVIEDFKVKLVEYSDQIKEYELTATNNQAKTVIEGCQAEKTYLCECTNEISCNFDNTTCNLELSNIKGDSFCTLKVQN